MNPSYKLAWTEPMAGFELVGERPRAVSEGARTVIPLTPAPGCPTMGFASVRPMIAAMLMDLAEAPEHASWIARVRPELVFLFPRLKERAEYHDAPLLEDVAVAPSRRRLHKESEQIFRVTQAIVQIILRWAAAKSPTGVDIIFHDLAGMDEQSLRVFMRLSHCVTDKSNIKVSARVVAPDAASTGTASAVDEVDEPSLRPFLRRSAMRRALIEDQKQRVPTEIVEIPADVAAPERQSFPTGPVEDWGSTQEGELTGRYLASLAEGDPARIGADLLAALEASVFTQNYDHAQWLIERSAQVFPLLSRAVRREVLVHLGILHAFTKDFLRALGAMEASVADAETPIERAESCFFAGLLMVKRMNRIEEGRARLHEALAHIDDQDTPEASCERAWLYNVLALSYVNEKKLEPARASCQKALANLKTTSRSPDATHIKINVITNLSLIDEYSKNIESALTRWGFFDHFLNNAGAVFTKHFLFRKGGLLAKAGKWDKAVEALARSYELSGVTGNAFYGDVIAQGIAGISYRLGQYVQSAEWYHQSLKAKAALLEDKDASRVTFALVLSQSRAGNLEQAERTLATLPPPDAATGYDPRLEQGLSQFRVGGPDNVDKSIEAWATPLPETKLNRPFDFTNLY